MELVKLFLIYIIWLAGLFSIGHAICAAFLPKFRPPFLELLLRNTLVGYLIVTIVQSIWATGFLTVNIAFIIILVFCWLELRKRSPFTQATHQSAFRAISILPICIVAFLLFLNNWLTIRDESGYLGYFFNQPDYIYYSKLAATVSSSGIENGFNVLNQLDSYYRTPQPYHFFDVWGATTVSTIFGINEYVSLMLIVYPTFYLLCFIAYLSLFKKINIAIYSLCFLLLFLGGLYFHILDSNSFFRSLGNISFNLLTPTICKLSYFYVFILVSFILFKKDQVILSLLSLLCLPVANIITVPTIIPALFITLCIAYFRKKIDKTSLQRGILYMGAVLLFIVCFYSLGKEQSSSVSGDNVSTSIQLLEGIFQQSMTTMVNIVIGGILSILILYCPFLMILGVNRSQWKLKIEEVSFVSVVIAASLVTYAILYIDFNAAQVFFNIAIPIINVSLSILFIAVVNSHLSYSTSTARIYILMSILVCLTAFNMVSNIKKQFDLRHQSHDNVYLSKIDKLLKPNALVASIKDAKDMNELYKKYNAIYPLGDYMFLLNKDIYAVNIGDLSTPIDSSSYMSLTRDTRAVKEGMFYRYSKENGGLSESQLMEKFLNQFQIKYLILSKHAAIPSNILANAKTIVEDPISGEKFVALH